MSEPTPETAPQQQESTGPEHQERPQQQRNDQRPRHQQNQQRPQTPWIDLSVVIPLFNEDESLRELHQQLRSALGRLNLRYEILFVDDGSTDRSFQVLRDLKRNDKHIKIIRFRRNYGKSAALSVGFEKALGNIVVTMDADLQDDPAEIPALKTEAGGRIRPRVGMEENPPRPHHQDRPLAPCQFCHPYGFGYQDS